MMGCLKICALCGLMILPGTSTAVEELYGSWLTKLTCPAKGNTEGYTWQFPATIQNSNPRGEHGVAGEKGYLLLEGQIKPDGNANLSASGIVVSRKYACGVFAHGSEDHNYDVKAQFKENEGTGTRNQGLGIVGRTRTFDFVKRPAAIPSSRE